MSLLRDISISCWLRKCSSSSFMPRTPSASQQTRCRSLSNFALLGREAIFGHKENDGLQDSPRAGCPCGEGEGYGKSTSQLHICMEGKEVEKIRNFLEWGGGTLVLHHQVGGSGFSGRGFDIRVCFLLRLPSSQLRGCCEFALRLLKPGRLPGGGH